jgi:hypothetical protein
MSETAELRLSEPQRLFARSQFPFPAFVGGYGSGKTFTGALRIISLQTRFPGVPMAYYMPTYGLVEDVAFPQFDELLDFFSIRHRLVKGRNFHIDVPDYDSRVLFRPLDTPAKIVGYKVGHSIIDELDTLPTDKAREVFRKIVARNRIKHAIPNSVGVVTTPEGFRFVYERWEKMPTARHRIYRARTIENAHNLSDDYIANMRDNFPANQLQAYLDGLFVNLTSGAVYHEFDRRLNGTTETMAPGETLHIGMDFNVGKMAAVIYVLRGDEPRAVMEHVNIYDTPAMAGLLKSTYQPDGKGHPIIVYPDASGKARKSANASESDFAVLRQAGFQVFVNPSNPLVKDRVLATNAQIHKGGARRLKVNTDNCPNLTEAFEKQVYDPNGEPDKTTGLDHVADAGTYPIAYRYPINKKIATVTPLRM